MTVKPTPELSGNKKVGFLDYIPTASQCFQDVCLMSDGGISMFVKCYKKLVCC